ncbi:MAG: isoamylase early set domain-containing protein [Chloroflexi bacterium]|nr:isoamylase early set domain-containing protein [Chloroflexota bacterium]
MVTQSYIKARKVYRLTFEVPPAELPEGEVSSLGIAGSFNDWNPEATPFTWLKKGVYKASVEVKEPGIYHYRYLLNGRQWLNDWHAEAYALNEHGEDNCVVTVTPA